METVKIKSVVQKGTTKKGNPYYTVTLEDGRQGTCFDKDITQKVNLEVPIEVKSSEYNGQEQLVFNLESSSNGAGKKGSGFNLGYSIKSKSLEMALKLHEITVSDDELLTAEEVCLTADKFVEWFKTQ